MNPIKQFLGVRIVGYPCILFQIIKYPSRTFLDFCGVTLTYLRESVFLNVTGTYILWIWPLVVDYIILWSRMRNEKWGMRKHAKSAPFKFQCLHPLFPFGFQWWIVILWMEWGLSVESLPYASLSSTSFHTPHRSIQGTIPHQTHEKH